MSLLVLFLLGSFSRPSLLSLSHSLHGIAQFYGDDVEKVGRTIG